MHREAQWCKAAPFHFQKIRGGNIYHNNEPLRAARGQNVQKQYSEMDG